MSKNKNANKLKKSFKKLMKAKIKHRNDNKKAVSFNPVHFPALEALGFNYFQGFQKEEL